MTRPKNLNTPYGQRYLKYIRNKQQAKEDYERKIASLLPFWSIDEYLQFKQFYF